MSTPAAEDAVPAPSPPPPLTSEGVLTRALLASVFVVAACGLVYELAAGALASYLLGDSVLQFSTVIGTYLFAMGVGSWLSRFFERQLPAHFLRIELLVALAGGGLPALLFVANAWQPGAFRPLLYGLVLLVGMLVGVSILTGSPAGDSAKLIAVAWLVLSPLAALLTLIVGRVGFETTSVLFRIADDIADLNKKLG